MLFRRQRHPAELQAERLANVVQHQLTRLNLAYREKRDGIQVVQQVQFVEPLIATPQEVKLEIDMSSMPRGVHITDLRDPKVLETLAVACKYPVRAEHKRGAGGGFWFVVELEERSKIPRMVKFDEMQLPDRAPALALPIGVGENGKQRWEDLRKLPHLLIAGATGQGKSVMVNAILCHLARRLAPAQLRLYLVDLKGGMELSFYKPLPHVDAFVTRTSEVPGLLLKLQAEMERRTRLMAERARDLDEYNDQVPDGERLPYIVAVIDEIANAMLSRDKIKVELDGTSRTSAIKLEVESLLADLAMRARATGIHLIISTQRPSVDVVTGLIKANFPCRIAFGTASEVDSRVIVDDSGALGLDKGRMKFRRNMELLEIQAPLIETDQVRRWVDAIARGEIPAEAPRKSREQLRREQCGLVLDIAEREYNKRLPVVRLAEHHAIAAAGIGHNRLDNLLGYLAAAGVIGRSWLRGGVYSVRWPRRRWAQMFPVPSPVLPLSGGDSVECRVSSNLVPARSNAVPVLELLSENQHGNLTELAQEPPATTIEEIISAAEDQRAALIRQLSSAGESRRQIARRLGGRYQDALRVVADVLGPARGGA